jgi:N-acetylglucosamine malate deacetylase 1
MSETILVIAAHPDDEVLGCGGTLARHASAGDVVHTLFLADGETSREGSSVHSSETRLRNANAAAEILGICAPITLGLPDNRLDSVALLEVVKAVEQIMAHINPTIIYTHHGGDLNIDHRVAHQATMTAARPLPDSKVGAIYSFETPSSTEWSTAAIGPAFAPNHFVNINDWAARKKAALACYDAELHNFPHARSHVAIEALATWRGASVGLRAAEAFVVERTVKI